MVSCLIVAVSAALQGSVGFGFALVAAPLLLLIDHRMVPGPVLFASLPLALMMAYRERGSVDMPGLKWSFVGMLPGTVVGAALLASIPDGEISLFSGGLVLLAVGMSLCGLYFRPTPGTLLGAGVLSGIMNVTASIGGPPMALVYQDRPGSRLRGTLSSYFIFSSGLSLLVLMVMGNFGIDKVEMSLLLLPGTLVGFVVSNRTLSLLDRGYTRAAVLTLSALAALAAILGCVL